jgi:hypothetical protein
MKRALGLAAILAAMLTMPAARVIASVDQQFFRSQNNKLYYVIKVDGTSGIGAQITSLIMTSGSAFPYNETAGETVLTSVSVQLSGGVLNFPPLSNIMRTAVVTGLPSNDIVFNNASALDGAWDPNANGGSGLLTLPGGTQTVTFDGSGTLPVTAVTNSSTGVPAATVTNVTRTPFFAGATTIVFPNPTGAVVTSDQSTGEVAGQNVSLDETNGSRVGNDASGASQENAVDGFLVRNTQDMIIFIVDGAGFSAFGLSASGFSVEGEALADRIVLDTTGDVDNGAFEQQPPPPPPSPTPGTPTPIASIQGLFLLAAALGLLGSMRLGRGARRAPAVG